jgi:hypothetical protein
VEKQYIFWETGKGCLASLLIYSVAVIVLVAVFVLIPDSSFLRWIVNPKAT